MFMLRRICQALQIQILLCVDNYIPKVLDGSYDPSFKLGLADKDMGLISGLAAHLNVPLPLGNLVYDAYREALDKYGFDVPHHEIIRLIEEQSDLELRYKDNPA